MPSTMVASKPNTAAAHTQQSHPAAKQSDATPAAAWPRWRVVVAGIPFSHVRGTVGPDTVWEREQTVTAPPRPSHTQLNQTKVRAWTLPPGLLDSPPHQESSSQPTTLQNLCDTCIMPPSAPLLPSPNIYAGIPFPASATTTPTCLPLNATAIPSPL
jgi:hypothetical protein